jgi:fermentation-respiration switch protein FrsA (DUF1100 family)
MIRTHCISNANGNIVLPKSVSSLLVAGQSIPYDQPKVNHNQRLDVFGSLIKWATVSNLGRSVLNSFGLVGLLATNIAERAFNFDIGFKRKIENIHNERLFQPNHTDYFPPPDKNKIQFEEIFIPVPEASSSYDQIRLNSSQSQEPTLHGYYFPLPKAELTMVYLHGYDGSADECYKDCLEIQEHIPVNILIVDYRGFGKSQGTPSREGVVKDVMAAYKYLEEVKNIKGDNIILCGASLGAGIAFETADRLAQINKTLAGITVLGSFSSVKDVAKWRFPHMPGFLILDDLFNSAKLVKKLHVPVFIAHGSNDKATPNKQSLKIFNNANDPKELFLIDGIGHDMVSQIPKETISKYGKAIRSFIERNILKKTFPETK